MSRRGEIQRMVYNLIVGLAGLLALGIIPNRLETAELVPFNEE